VRTHRALNKKKRQKRERSHRSILGEEGSTIQEGQELF
jgi:hypothetical protein